MEKFDWLQAFAAEQQEQPEPGVSADAAPEDVQERAEAFRALIQGPYKKDYDRQVQTIVRERLKNCARSEQVLKSLSPALQKTFGVDAAQLTPEQAERFGEKMNRAALTAAYERGVSQMSLDRCCWINGAKRWLTLWIEMTRNPATGSLEASVYSFDIDDRKALEQIMDTLLHREYRMLLRIDLTADTARVFSARNGKEPAREITGAEQFLLDGVREGCDEDELDETLDRLRLDRVRDRLEHGDEYVTYADRRSPGGGVRRLRLRRPMAALTACTALVAALTTGFTVGTYQRAYTQTIGLTTTEIYGDVIHSGDGLPDALPYRYYFWEPYSNRGMAAYLPDRTSFLSTLSPSIFTLYDALGDERHAITPAGPEGTNELLSVGYYIRNNSDWPDEIYTSFSNGHEQINVYQDSHALPIGFCYDTYMTRSEFDEIDPAERAHSMLKTLVVADEDEATVSTILRHYDAALDGKISQENKYADMDKRREACTDVFDYGTDYFYSEITSGSEQYAFFSVPYDKAWSATVNGESAEILNINGLMAVKVNAGKNCIRFHYSPTPLWCGIGVSAISILLTAIYLLAGRRSRKSKKEVL